MRNKRQSSIEFMRDKVRVEVKKGKERERER